MDITILTSEKELRDNIGSGYKYLPKEIVDIIKAKQDYHTGIMVIHPIIKAVAGFDHTYHYSDDITAWRSGCKREKELLEQIESLDITGAFTKLQIDALYAGMSKDDLFYKTFSYAKVCYGNMEFSDIENDIILGNYDEDRILAIQETLNTLLPVWDIRIPVLRDNMVWSEGDPHKCMYNGQAKYMLSEGSQGLISSIMTKLARMEDIEYYAKWISVIGGFYGSIEKEGYGRILTKVTALPMKVTMSKFLNIELNGDKMVPFLTLYKTVEMYSKIEGHITMAHPLWKSKAW